jgi:hypothetical protein
MNAQKCIPALLLFAATAALGGEGTTVTVDCAKGDTLAKALGQGNAGKPLLLLVRGTCSESVRIERDDVTLRPDAGFDAIEITGGRKRLHRPHQRGVDLRQRPGRRLLLASKRKGVRGRLFPWPRAGA